MALTDAGVPPEDVKIVVVRNKTASENHAVVAVLVDGAWVILDNRWLALAHIDSFEPGTNMPAWLFTILRNLFRSEYRKRRREVEDAEGRYAETLKSHPEQTGRVEFEEFRAALAKLPADQREALILVGASGFSYDDAAAICGCAVGTIKSRVNRARTRLADLLAIDSVDDFGPDRATRAVLAGGGRN